MTEIQIHQNLTRVAKSIVVNIDIGNLTKNQLKRVANQVENGYATSGDATTSYMTRSILREHKIPHFIVGNESNSYITWQNIPSDHPIFDELAGAVALTKLTVPDNDHQKQRLEQAIKKWDRILLERPTTGNFDLYEIDYIVRDKVHAVGRLKIDKDHKVYEFLKVLPDMKTFPLLLGQGQNEYSYPLPYEETDEDSEEYYK